MSLVNRSEESSITEKPRSRKNSLAVTPSVSGSRRGPAIFVWGVWVLMVFGNLAFVAQYGSRIPLFEDYESLVPRLTGAEPITLEWVWGKGLAEHHEPVFFLLNLALLKLNGGDFRAPMVFMVLVLAGLSWAMIRVARNLQGRLFYSDAFIPLALLQFCWYLIYVSGGMAAFMSTVVAGILLLIVVQYGTRLSLRTGVVAGICLIMLPLLGPYGLVYQPALLAWYGFAGIQAWITQGRAGKRNCLIFLALSLGALALTYLYLKDYPGQDPSTVSSLKDVLAFSLGFFTAGFGEATYLAWPLSGFIMLILLLASAGFLIRVAWRQSGINRFRAVGLFFFLGSRLVAALILGKGRAFYGIHAPWEYYTFPVLTICWLYFAWKFYEPRNLTYSVQMGLFTLMCFASSLNLEKACAQAALFHVPMQALDSDMRAGVPPYLLALHHRDIVLVGPLQDEGNGLDSARASNYWAFWSMLKKAGIAPFAQMVDDPPCREVALTPQPTAAAGVKWKNETASGAGPEASLVFFLPQPTFVLGIRLQLTYTEGTAAGFTMSWKGDEASSFPETPQYSYIPGISAPWTVLVGDTIKEIRIHPSDEPFRVQIAEVVALVPETGAPAPVANSGSGK